MARRHVASHVKKLQMHQQRHRKNVWKIFKKLARHKACYDKGGMMLMGMGMRKKKKAGMMLYGMGLRKPGYKKRTIKLPAWVTKQIPKKGKRFPKVPKGFSKRAGAFWRRHKKIAESKQLKASGLAKDIWNKGKETVKKVGTHVIETAKKHAKVLAEKGMKLLNDHADEFSDLASKFIDEQADKYAEKASTSMDKYGKKKGSGWGGWNTIQRPARRTRLDPRAVKDRIRSTRSKKGSGIQFNLIRKAATDIALRRSRKKRGSGLALDQVRKMRSILARQRARASGAIQVSPDMLSSGSSLLPRDYLQQNRGNIQQALQRARGAKRRR